jgi:hypothetical protein
LRAQQAGALNWAIFWFQRDGDLMPDGLAEVFISIFLGGVARDSSTSRRQI